MTYSLFGFNVHTDFRFTIDLPRANGNPDLTFSCVSQNTPRTLDTGNHVFSSRATNHFGEPEAMLFSNSVADVMRFPRIADFVIRPGSIVCELLDPECAYLVQICLLGHVFGYYLERSGYSSIHGASVAVGESAVLLVGHRRAGKSTMAGSLLNGGLPLLADDISALEVRNTSILCRPAYPQIKLTPGQACLFGLDSANYAKVHPAFEKLNVPMSDLGEFHPTPLPARCVYLIERVPDESTQVEIVPVPPGEALIELLRHTFITDIIEATDLQAPRMKRLAQIAKILPVKRLRYPSGYENLPLVHEAIQADTR